VGDRRRSAEASRIQADARRSVDGVNSSAALAHRQPRDSPRR